MKNNTHQDGCGQPVDVAVGILLEKGTAGSPSGMGINRRFLITRRPAKTVYGGWWEFPGGKVNPGESPREAVVRELYEEIGVDARVVSDLTCHTHVYEHATVRLHAMVCEPEAGSPEPRPVEVQALAWTSIGGLDPSTFLPANGPLVAALGAWLRVPGAP